MADLGVELRPLNSFDEEEQLAAGLEFAQAQSLMNVTGFAYEASSVDEFSADERIVPTLMPDVTVALDGAGFIPVRGEINRVPVVSFKVVSSHDRFMNPGDKHTPPTPWEYNLEKRFFAKLGGIGFTVELTPLEESEGREVSLSRLGRALVETAERNSGRTAEFAYPDHVTGLPFVGTCRPLNFKRRADTIMPRIYDHLTNAATCRAEAIRLEASDDPDYERIFMLHDRADKLEGHADDARTEIKPPAR